MRRRGLLGALAAGLAAPAALARRAAAAAFPEADRPIRLVVPFPPGGTSDLRARQVADRLREGPGWRVLVENRPGASGLIGSGQVARAPADGHTLLLGTIGTLAINPHLFPQQPYDVLRDFQPVTQFSRSVIVLLAHADTRLRTLADLERAGRGGRPLAFASTGNGTIGHMVGELYRRRAGLDLTHVPYKGTTPAVQDFVGGQVPLLLETPSAVWAHLQAGTAVPLAVSGSARMPQLPAVPTFRELGHPDLVFDTWQGLVAPRGLPEAVLDRVHREVVAALLHPTVVRSHEEQVNEVVAGTPVEFERLIAQDTERWGRVVRETGITVG